MKQEIEDLLDVYESRLKTINLLIFECSGQMKEGRLLAKRSCFNVIIKELKEILKDNI